MRARVYSAMERIAAGQSKALPPLSDDLVLLDMGLDSLFFAILVTQLEAETGVDPFTASDE